MARRRRFADRRDAGEQLAALLATSLPPGDRVVLGLPRGGVVVAAAVADRLGAPLDVVVTRKVGAPGHEEFGIGAVAEGGALVLDDDSVRAVGVGDHELHERIEAERRRVDDRVARYRHLRPRVPLAGRHVVVVDDGLATGVTARAALLAVRAEDPASITLAVPVAPPDSLRRVGELADDTVAVVVTDRFGAVGEFYDRFDQTTDDEVLEVLAASRESGGRQAHR